MITLNQVREKFLNFFSKNNFKIIKSSSLVPNDPSLLFTNAGMVQLKNYFTGIEKPPFRRATSVQKCVRAGGKHNDLDNVGYTARHHTFFEMLGNFSFGDLSKKDALILAWTFLTKELQLPEEKLLATIYYKDEEAYNIWKNIIKIPEEKIIRLAKDNFWAMGDTGPCGPSSEIFYDHGDMIKGEKPGSPDENGDRFIEIWNVVFMEFERNEKGELKELPKKCIDTGIGLERITAVLQNVHNNYDIDLFQKIIENSKLIIGDGDIFCHRIIADHLRSSCFLISDGVLPSNEGRGYVLRRIMRRAMLQIHKIKCKKTIMFKLVPNFINLMGDIYPELKEYEELIINTLKSEEDKFRMTLDKGLIILENKTKELKSNVLSGNVAFELYDTYGFPLDLTEMILKEQNILVNHQEFEEEMNKQKERARANWIGSGDTKNNELVLQINEKTLFEGYDKTTTSSARIIKIIKNNEFVASANNSDEVEIILDKSCFYGESGGQVGDIGLMIGLTKEGSISLPFSIFDITNTLKSPNSIIIHKGKVENGIFHIGDLVNLTINRERRNKIAANHSSAHLLQNALKSIFGPKVTQKGSYVDEFKLRFDIAYNGQIKPRDLKNLEEIVNTIILQNSEVKTENMNLDEAKKSGAIALFNEKYEDNVRVVFMGKNKKKEKYNELEKKENYKVEDVIYNLSSTTINENDYLSIELCCGTHVKKTGDIGLFKIIKEESIASGIRRIECITGLEVLKYINNKLDLLSEINNQLKSDDNKIIEKIELIQKENKELLKINSFLEKEKLKNLPFKKFQKNEIKILFNEFKNINVNDLKFAVNELINEKFKENTIIIALCKNNDKNIIIVSLSKDLTKNYDANLLLKNFGAVGGGQKHYAMGSMQLCDLETIVNNI